MSYVDYMSRFTVSDEIKSAVFIKTKRSEEQFRAEKSKNSNFSVPASEREKGEQIAKPEFRLRYVSAICASFVILLCAIIIPIALNNTPPSTPPVGSTKLEWGFQYSDGMVSNPASCAYRSESNTFDINNVTLTLYFGGYFSSDIELERENVWNIPEFDVYFAGYDPLEQLHLIRHSTDNFVSEEYRTNWLFDEQHYLTEIQYNHSEVVTVPANLFSKQQGIIGFCVGGININNVEPKYEIITCAYLNYDMVDEKVVLSPWDGYRQ